MKMSIDQMFKTLENATQLSDSAVHTQVGQAWQAFLFSHEF